MSFRERLRRILNVGSNTEIAESVSRGDFPEISDRDFSRIQDVLGYGFRNPDLLILALVHRSHIHSTGATRLQTNERLEFLGDAVLGMAVSDYLYRQFPECQEGELTKMKSILVCGENLARMAVKHDLGRFVQMSKGEASSGGRERASILADVVEALLGAIFLDGGVGAAYEAVDHLILEDARERLADEDLDNFKSRLQELIQAEYKVPPRYSIVVERGPDHDKHYEVQVAIRSEVLGRGEGTSKKSAEQNAARDALGQLQPESADHDVPPLESQD
jgi:ribonuclease III